MSMNFSVNFSNVLIDLLRKGAAQIDAIEWVDRLPLEQIAQTRAEFPALPFHFHPGRMHAGSKWLAHLQAYMQACPQSPFVSVHLAPLPYIWTQARMQAGLAPAWPIPALPSSAL